MINSVTNSIPSSNYPSSSLVNATRYQRYQRVHPPYTVPPLVLNTDVTVPMIHPTNEEEISPCSTSPYYYSSRVGAESLSATTSPTVFPPGPSTASPSPLEVPTVVLTEKDMWKSFCEVGNEMIVTKPGRRLFPIVLVTIRGLNLSLKYNISARFVSADSYRYKYICGRWISVGESDVIQDESRMIYAHPTSPNTGEYWMKKPITFKSIKITHHLKSKNGNILLHTMHKYRIEVVIKATDRSIPDMVFPLPHTDFIAVTSYQSSAITKLKVDHNPFAKGFRDQEEGLMISQPPYHQPPHPAHLFPSPFNPYQLQYYPSPMWNISAPPIPSIHTLLSNNSRPTNIIDTTTESNPSSTVSSPQTPNEF